MRETKQYGARVRRREAVSSPRLVFWEAVRSRDLPGAVEEEGWRSLEPAE